MKKNLQKGWIGALAAVKFAVAMLAGQSYGYFRDELYYIDCSRHLAWGYVDQPPLVVFIAWIVRHTLGDSILAMRFLPAAAGAAELVMTAMIAGELGGGPFAQVLAGIAVLAAPGILIVDSFFSMNAFEPVIWLGCAWIVIRIVKTGNAKLWLWFGLLSGIGLENKYSMAMFAAGIVFGLLLTKQRKLLWTPWILLGGAIAFAIFLPNLVWNIQHHFPFLELQRNIRASGRDVILSPVAFFLQELEVMHPLGALVWLAGLWFYFFTERGREYRFLGWAWIFTALVIVALSPRTYYLFPAFPILFAAGGIVWETLIANRALRVAFAATLLITAAILAPIAIPILSPERFIRYSQSLHLNQPRIENHKLGPLPQIFADSLGWPEMVAEVAKAYNALPPDVRTKTAIFAQNYGEAGAIDLYGPKYGLPPAISGHQTLYLWGPRDYTGESMIVLNDGRKKLEKLFSSVQLVGHVDDPYSMPVEHFDIYYCQGLHGTLRQLWPKIKKWD